MKFPLKVNGYNLLALGMLAWIGVFAVTIWISTNGFPEITENAEVFFNYLASKNFIQFGLLRNYLLEDVATSPAPAAHPVYYTNNPNLLTKLFSYFLLSSGVVDIRWHILIAVPIFLLGQWYFYQLNRRFLGEAGGMWVLFFSATGYLMSLSWSLNLFRAWYWLLFCCPLFHLTAIDEVKNKVSARLHTALFLLWLALLSTQDYRFLLFFSFVVFGLKGFGALSWSWRRLALCWGGVVVPLVVLHQLLVIQAIGLENWSKSVIYTIGNRAVGNPPREEIQAFFDQIGVVLWGYSGEPVSLKNLFFLAWQKLNETLGIVGGWIVILGSFACAILAVLQSQLGRQDRQISGWDKSLRYLGGLSLGVIGMALIGSKDFGFMYVLLLFPLLVFFAYPCLAFALVTLSQFPRLAREKIKIHQRQSSILVLGGVNRQFYLKFPINEKLRVTYTSLKHWWRGYASRQNNWAVIESIRATSSIAAVFLLLGIPVALALRSWALHGFIFYLVYCAACWLIGIGLVLPGIVAKLFKNPTKTIRVGAGLITGLLLALSPALLLHRSHNPTLLGFYSPTYVVFLGGYSLVCLMTAGICGFPTRAMALLRHMARSNSVRLITGSTAIISFLLLTAVSFNQRFQEFLGFLNAAYLIFYFLGVGIVALAEVIRPGTILKRLLSIVNACGSWIRNWLSQVGGVAAISISLVLIPYASAQLNSLQSSANITLPAAEILERYRGYSFITNYTSAYVNYFTQEWAILFPNIEAVKIPLDLDDLKFVFERDKLSNLEYRYPDFYLCGFPRSQGGLPSCLVAEELEEAFPVVASGERWRIYDLRQDRPDLWE